MRILIIGILLLALAVLCLMAWIRMVPHDVERWHRPLTTEGPGPTVDVYEQGARAVSRAYPVSPQELLSRIDSIAQSSPRTRLLAGDVASGRITYVTRTLFWGFPDYTTVQAVDSDAGSQLVIHARLRFGGSDFGVNAARVRAWLQALDQPG